MHAPTLTLVVNPTAGRGKAVRVLPSVVQELLKGAPSARLDVVRATSYDEARVRCIAAVEAARATPVDGRHDCLVVMGGDGMMHLGLNAAAGSGVPLGLIPAGTGNDFCRGVGVPGSAVAAAKVIAEGHTHAIDLTRVSGELADGSTQRYVGSVVSTGYDARVNRRANAMTYTLGSLGYAYSALAELARFEPLSYRISMDGVRRTQTAMLIAVANAGVFGGGMRIAPDYSVTDGLLDVTIIHPVSRLTLLRLLPAMFSGKFVSDPAVERARATHVTIDGDGLYGMADGEALGP
ncbi:MAG TPA: YegS/Rv2252/BmrU family lipid kinase, partial [Propionibacteriaceae bacterium]|nr:YegS/Rv2252/BmrU family lipid kinase [Propionibacteriaceae bacterium]